MADAIRGTGDLDIAAGLPRAILFDLDETIVAAGNRPQILRAIAEEFAAELAPFPASHIADQLEAAFVAFWSDSVRHKAARFGIPEAVRKIISEVFARARADHLSLDLAARFEARFTAHRDEVTDLFPSARETIETLKDRGVRLALVTNGGSDTQRAKIERFGLGPLFDHIQIEGEHGFGKPEERAYFHAMAALGVRAHETWMVGDNLEWEVAAPQRLGIFAVWHDGLGQGLPPDSDVRPDKIIRALPELLKP